MSDQLTSKQQSMIEMWERHMAAEFGMKSIDATMATMTSHPYVNHVPVMTGGVGSDEVRKFYSTYFLPGHPPDTQTLPVARTVGEDRMVDEPDSQVYPHDGNAVAPPWGTTYEQTSQDACHCGCAI